MSAVTLSEDAGIATLSIDQPQGKVNVLSRLLWAELEEALTLLRAKTGLSGLMIVSSKPGIFIAGADIRELAEVPSAEHLPTREFMNAGHRVLAMLATMPFPTAACIDGAALGGGLEVALACDLRLAGTHPRVSLGLPEVSLGLIPGWGGTQRTPRLIGPATTFDLIVDGEPLDADRALERGLVNAIVPSEMLHTETVRHLIAVNGTYMSNRTRHSLPVPIAEHPATLAGMADGLADSGMMNAMSLSAEALQARRDGVPEGAKRLAALAAIDVIDGGCRLPLDEALAVEHQAFMQLTATPECRSLIAAFFAKRGK